MTLDFPDTYSYRMLVALRRIIHGVDLYSRKINQKHNITVPQLFCLFTLQKNGALILSDLSRRVHLTASTVNGILDRLERKGLVHRERLDSDRRKVRAAITAQGTAVVEGEPLPLQDVLTSAVSRLPELEQAAIALSLERIVELMGIEGVEPAPLFEQQNGTRNPQEENL